MTALVFERAWPYAAGVIGLVVWWLSDWAFPREANDLLATTSTVASVLVGFLATAKTIVLSISSTAVYQQLKHAGVMAHLFEYLASAIYAGIVVLVVCVIGFFVETGSTVYGGAWVLAAVTALALYVRITSLLFKLLRHA